ncbi:uncharacterized protein LOC134239637 [Saccostrea cucullata]|uniref:uncharacterized protein LOC134239637 n=1 Tax=Saccostrea cuccullata TaxID=36930 RepID=UPI002ED5BB28
MSSHTQLNRFILKFIDWNIEVYGTSLDMLTVDIPTLSNRLSKFYCSAMPKGKDDDDKSLYHKNSLINIRAAINRHLADLRRDVNVVKDKEFRTANGILDGLFKERTQLGLSKPTKHKEIIEIHDLQKIYQYLKGAPSSPVILRHAV